MDGTPQADHTAGLAGHRAPAARELEAATVWRADLAEGGSGKTLAVLVQVEFCIERGYNLTTGQPMPDEDW
jgi:hypothetical protein